MQKKHIVIVGGGFGGIYTARYLKPLVKKGLIDVTIINRKNYFLFTPLLHEVATGGLSPISVVEPIREIFRHDNIRIVVDEVKHIDTQSRQVETLSTTFSYDYLVISSGAETNYYGVQGARENTLNLKDLRDAQILRKKLIDACEKGSLSEDEKEKEKILSTVIVGAGPTGVELAAEIMEFMHETLCAYYHMCGLEKKHMKISLVAASKEILPQFPIELCKIAEKRLVKKNINVMKSAEVVEVKPGRIIFKDNSFLEADTIIWVAGIKPSSLEIQGAAKEKNGRIKMNEFLQVEGVQNIFSLGDVSGTAPQLAQIAVRQGKIVAENISASISNTPLTPFKYEVKALLLSLGQWYATGKIFGIVLRGPFMWLIWRAIYLFNFHNPRKRIKIATEWIINFFYPRDITEF